MAEIVIIGGGVAGLSAGIYSQLAGHRATILEQHTTPGGNLTGWDRGGCHIDNCIHWLTGTNPVTRQFEVWKTLGALGSVGVYQPDTLYTYEADGKSLSLSRDLNRLRADMLALCAQDQPQIDALLRAVRAMMRLSGIAGAQCDRRSTAVEKARALQILARYLPLTAGGLAARFRDPTIRGFLSSFLTERFGAIALLSVFATFCAGDGGLPRGSSRAMAARMAARFESLGGTLLCGARAAKVNLRGKRAVSVTLADGRTFAADHVILAADPAAVFGRLLDRSLMPAALEQRYRDARLRRFSSCHCAFVCDTGQLPFRGDLILTPPASFRAAFGAEHLILREFSHAPEFAPPGKSVLQTMFFCGQTACRELLQLAGKPAAYRAYKQALAENVAQAVCGRFPSLCGQLRCLDVWTPATYRRYTGAEIGSYMSFAFTSRFLPRPLPSRVKGTENLYLATQWQSAPGGLPVAANAGRAAVEGILQRERRHSVSGALRAKLPPYRVRPSL